MTAIPHRDLVGRADTDADLARAAAAGDRSAFAGIYDRYADRLHDFCIGMLRDRDDAADCVQDAFCTAATRLDQLRDADKLRPWLYAIARNEALRRLRDRQRVTVSDDLPDTVSDEPGPETLAARTELADLVSEAAGGLSDRDRSILELTYRHGLDGPDLAEVLNVTTVNATKMVQRLRDTVERALGALLVARRIRNTGTGCGELAAILDGWDGEFTVLMRKRIARHIESCPTCNDDRQRLVSPVALLGATPVFIPAPEWLRERTLNEIELTSSSSPIQAAKPDPGDIAGSDSVAAQTISVTGEPVEDKAERRTRRALIGAGLLAVVVAVSLGLALGWQQEKEDVDVAPADVTQTATKPVSVAPFASQPETALPAPPTATMPLPRPPVPEPPPVAPTTTYEAPPPSAVAPGPPAVIEEPAPASPPEPDLPDVRRPASDLPNDAVLSPPVRTPTSGGTASVPPSKTAEPSQRRVADSPPPASKPPSRTGGGSGPRQSDPDSSR